MFKLIKNIFFKNFLLTAVISALVIFSTILFVKNRQLTNYVNYLQYKDSVNEQKLNNCALIQKQLEISMHSLEEEINQTLTKYSQQTDSLESCEQNVADLRKKINYFRTHLKNISYQIHKIYKYSLEATTK